MSYGRVLEDIRALTSYLSTQSTPIEKIALYGENSYEWIISFFATTYSNKIAVPIAKENPEETTILQVTHTHCELFLYSSFYEDTIQELKEKLSFCRFICFDEIPGIIAKMKAAGATVTLPQINPDDLSAIVHTSGTLGIGKGVMLSHKNFLADVYGCMEQDHLTGNTILLLPLHHCYGLMASVLTSLTAGRTLYINSNLGELMSDMKNEKPVYIHFVPLILEAVYRGIWQGIRAKHQEDEVKRLLEISASLKESDIAKKRELFASIVNELGGVHTIICGGASVNTQMIDNFALWGIEIIDGYGITECSPVVAVSIRSQYVPGSAGRIISTNDVQILNPDKNGIGEIAVKGDNVMLGYYKDPEATKSAFRGDYFLTGDLGYVDDDNNLYIKGRLKNLIVLSNGENVSAEELENRIMHLDPVKEVLVYQEDQKITAEVYPQEGSTYDDVKSAILKLNQLLPPHKGIQSVKVRETEFPKTTSRKIKRYA
jgi:long-chain acyl-CoA synthetase